MNKKFARILSIPAALAVMAGNALAEVPTVVQTELGTAKTDSATVAGLVLAAIIGLFTFTLIRKAIK